MAAEVCRSNGPHAAVVGLLFGAVLSACFGDTADSTVSPGSSGGGGEASQAGAPSSGSGGQPSAGQQGTGAGGNVAGNTSAAGNAGNPGDAGAAGAPGIAGSGGAAASGSKYGPPETVAQLAVSGPGGRIAVLKDYIVVTRTSSLEAISRSTGALTKLGMNGFSGLSVLDANRAWVGDGSGLVVEYLAGANSLTTMFSVKPDLAIGFAPAGSSVFVLTRGGVSLRSGATNALVWSLPFAGLPAKPTGGQIEVLGGRYIVSVPDLGRIFDVSDGVAVEWAKMSSPYSMAADGDRMFVVKAPPPAGVQVVMDTPMSVIEFDTSGTELSVVVEEPYGVGRLAAAGGELVWARLCSTKQVGSALMRRASDGTVEVLADDKTFSCQISFAYADDGIYWTNVSASGAAELRRVRRL